MLTLAQAEEEHGYTVKGINGDARFISRITSVGLIIGGTLKVIRNAKRLPLLIYSRNTMLAINRQKTKNIHVEMSDK